MKNRKWSYKAKLKDENGNYIDVGTIDQASGNIFEQIDRLYRKDISVLKKSKRKQK